MNVLVVPEKGCLEVREVMCPAPGPYQALVQNEVCGICSSTDWKVALGQMSWAGPFPLALGHESVGRVVEVGAKVRNFRIGDRVTRSVLPGSAAMNSAFGGFAEFGVVTDAAAMTADGDASLSEDYLALRQLVVPAFLDDPVQAALAISLAETASGMRSLPNLRGRRVLVAGTGMAGLAFTLWARLAGADKVVTLGRRSQRLDLALRLGAGSAVATTASDWMACARDALDGPAEIVIEAVGDVDLADRLLTLLAADGVAAAYGAPPDGATFSPPWIVMPVEEQRDFAWAATMLRLGLVRPEWFVSHVWDGLDAAPTAFAAVRRGEIVKGFIRIS